MKTANVTFENGASRFSHESMAHAMHIMNNTARTLRNWKERASTRRALSQLSYQMLEDTGIEPGEAQRESRKPFWRA